MAEAAVEQGDHLPLLRAANRVTSINRASDTQPGCDNGFTERNEGQSLWRQPVALAATCGESPGVGQIPQSAVVRNALQVEESRVLLEPL